MYLCQSMNLCVKKYLVYYVIVNICVVYVLLCLCVENSLVYIMSIYESMCQK